ncbi:excisionase [Massilia orientalis]|uniref:Excisionase n=1 Tax=Massilia orientalis TaxID=3050128 RepID=A0ACC7MBK7_9BURK|nr:excisionase [Massilia sp. YIM B02787]
MLRYLTIRKFAAESGYTEDAIRSKIHAGIWMQDKVWKKAPDGRILVDVEGYHEWVESGGALKLRLKGPAHGSSPPPLV